MHSIQLLGNFLRALSVILVICRPLLRESCKGLSLKTQVLYLLVFLTRVADLVSPSLPSYFYNDPITCLFKAGFIISQTMVIVIFLVLENSYKVKKDSFWIGPLIVGASVIAFYMGYGSTYEIIWHFSILLDAVAVLPQIYMYYLTGRDDSLFLSAYFLTLLGYKTCYIMKWFVFKRRSFLIMELLGVFQFFTYVAFFFTPKRRGPHPEVDKLACLLDMLPDVPGAKHQSEWENYSTPFLQRRLESLKGCNETGCKVVGLESSPPVVKTLSSDDTSNCALASLPLVYSMEDKLALFLNMLPDVPDIEQDSLQRNNPSDQLLENSVEVENTCEADFIETNDSEEDNKYGIVHEGGVSPTENSNRGGAHHFAISASNP